MAETINSAKVVDNLNGTLNLQISDPFYLPIILITGVQTCPIYDNSTVKVRGELSGKGEDEILNIIALACILCPLGPDGTAQCEVGDKPRVMIQPKFRFE